MLPSSSYTGGLAGGLRDASRGSGTQWGYCVPGAMVVRPYGAQPDASGSVRICGEACAITMFGVSGPFVDDSIG